MAKMICPNEKTEECFGCMHWKPHEKNIRCNTPCIDDITGHKCMEIK